MVQSLSGYVQQLQRNGYSLQAIRAHLVRSGYSVEDAERAVLFSLKEGSSVSVKKLVFFVGVLVVVLFGVYFLFFYGSFDVSLVVRSPA